MNINSRIKRLCGTSLAAVAMTLSLASCDSVIYNNEGDCDVNYHLRFRYDMNMKYADAFSHEVKSVHLYAFDKDDRLVWQTTERGERLSQEGYEIDLPLPAGDYSLMAWCGLDNGESFTVPEIKKGESREALHCRLNRTQHPEDGAVSTDNLHSLFHGTLNVNLPENLDGGDYTYTMPLTKDTNVFRIVLQHLSGEDIDVNDFTFKIEDNNGWLHHDNALRDDEKITYHAWSTYSGQAGVDIKNPEPGSRAITDVKVAVAELTTSRLVDRDWTKVSKPMLTIRKAADGDLVARIPVIDYALMVKGYENKAMSNQEFLDRQDEYNMTFFLNENDKWLATVIIINSWRVVLNETELN